MSGFFFKDRDGQTPLPPELQKGLKVKSIQTIGELDEFEEDNIASSEKKNNKFVVFSTFPLPSPFFLSFTL